MYDIVHKQFIPSTNLLAIGRFWGDRIGACFKLPSGELDYNYREMYYDTEDNCFHVDDNVLGKMVDYEFEKLCKNNSDDPGTEPSESNKDVIGVVSHLPIKQKYSSLYGQMGGVNNESVIEFFLRHYGKVIFDDGIDRSYHMDGLVELKAGNLAGFMVGKSDYLNELYFDETIGEIRGSNSKIGGVFDTTLPNLEESIRRYNDSMTYEYRKISRLVTHHPHTDIIVDGGCDVNDRKYHI